MIRAIVCGAGGRMGGRIAALIHEADDFALAGAVERPGHPGLGKDAGEAAGIGKIGIPVTADAKVPMVLGTTGLGASDLRRAKELSAVVPCVVSPNMSVGVNLLFKVLAEVAAALGGDYDDEIFETHHRFKKDSPSGTALRMAQVVASALGRDLDKAGIYGRKGMVGERGKEEIAVHALSAGDVVGEHTVVFGGMGERIEITHRAHSRDTFARGALRAARWVVGRPPGLYDMQDVLGLKG